MSAGVNRTFLCRNPHRFVVLGWYHKFLRAAFEIPWESDEDALYVLEETRRLFRMNAHITDNEVIQRKLREAEMRYELAVHYRIPYPRPFHKTQGSVQESGVAYAPYLDSMYDHPVSPRTGPILEGSANYGTMGGAQSAAYYFEDNMSTTDAEGRDERVP